MTAMSKTIRVMFILFLAGLVSCQVARAQSRPAGTPAVPSPSSAQPGATSKLTALLSLDADSGVASRTILKAAQLDATRYLRDDPGLQSEVERTLVSSRDSVMLSRVLVSVAALRMDKLTPMLQRVSIRTDIPPTARVLAMQTAAKLRASDTSLDAWVNQTVDTDFRTWNSTEQDLYLSLLSFQDPAKGAASARRVESWASQMINGMNKDDGSTLARRGELGHILSTARRQILEADRARQFDAIAGKNLAEALINEFIENQGDDTRQNRAVQMIYRRVKDTAIASVRSRLGMAPQETDRALLLLLLDRLGVTLSGAELAQLEAVIPPPPL